MVAELPAVIIVGETEMVTTGGVPAGVVGVTGAAGAVGVGALGVVVVVVAGRVATVDVEVGLYDDVVAAVDVAGIAVATTLETMSTLTLTVSMPLLFKQVSA